jgi:hypothetical protein
LLGNTKFEFYKINSVPKNNNGSEDDENLRLLCFEREHASNIEKYSSL